MLGISERTLDNYVCGVRFPPPWLSARERVWVCKVVQDWRGQAFAEVMQFIAKPTRAEHPVAGRRSPSLSGR